jgi:aspartyl protease family protein
MQEVANATTKALLRFRAQPAPDRIRRAVDPAGGQQQSADRAATGHERAPEIRQQVAGRGLAGTGRCPPVEAFGHSGYAVGPEGAKGGRGGWSIMRVTVIAAILLALIALLLLTLNNFFPQAMSDPNNRMRIFATTGWLLLLVAGAATRFRSQPGTALRSLSAWLLIGLALVWVYAYRFEAQEIGNRLLGELVPGHGVVTETADNSAGGQAANVSEIRFALNQEGHYQINARVNGTYVTFLVDTGASDVVLSPDDARRIGLADNQLRFIEQASTANGIVYVAPVILNNLSIGPISMNRLPAKVNQAPMPYSLLGMSFLNQLRGWRVQQRTLILEE